MATVYKILGKTAVVAATPTLVYTVPANYAAVVSTIIICNTSSTAYTYRIAICPGAIASVTLADYIAYDATIGANDTVAITIGATMAAASQVLVQASNAAVVFSLFGSEIA